MNRRKKIIITATILTIAELLAPKKYKAKVKVEIPKIECDYFAKYRNGYVYIGDKDYIEEISEFVSPNDILIVDERLGEDSNFKVINSYRIIDSGSRDDIIFLLHLYNEIYPMGNWQRTDYSMRNEWEIHNLLYRINYKLERTTDVDFDIDDENKFNSKILKNILHN